MQPNQFFSVAVPARHDWPLDGNDTIIAGVNGPITLSEPELLEWAAKVGESHARLLGTHLHHGEFVITSDLITTVEWGIMPDHRDCADCRRGVERSLEALHKDPDLTLIIGQLYWSPNPP